MEAGRSPNIEILSNADLLSLDGKPGDFTAKLRLRPRYIDADKCTACGLCTKYCPKHLVDQYNEGLAITRPIHIDYAQAVPATYYIDPAVCLHVQHGTCQICVPTCQSKAIDFSQKAVEKELNIGAVIVAPGFGRVPEATLAKYSYGQHPDVVTSLEFERMLCASGPFEGELKRISDKHHPKRIAFIQCVGSRDLGCDNGYCSSVCCMYAIKEAMVAKEHDPEVEITIYYMDMRTQGKGFDAAQKKAESMGIKFVRAKVADVMPWETKLKLTFSTMDGSHSFEPYDMVVLSVGLDAPADAKNLANITGISLNNYDFCETKTFAPLLTSKPGIFVAGAFQGPKDIPESVTQSSAAAGLAAGLITKDRGKALVHKSYPEERSIAEEEVRIGVFVCHCGINIGSVVDVPMVEQYTDGMEGVVYHAQSLYSCSQDAQEVLKAKIKEHNLNRVVIAACSPRTHEPLFQETLKDAGLNRCLFEMVNIRDHCSWVHANEPEAATKKSMDLVRMGIAKARHIQPLPEQTVPVTDKALVLGGGVAGLTAALTLAEQGFHTYVVEREDKLGGHLLHLAYTLQGDTVGTVLSELADKIKKNKKIEVLTNSALTAVSGFVGNFSSVISTTKGKNVIETTIDHGVIIVATGGHEHRPEMVLGNAIKYSDTVVTQRELEQRLAGKAKVKAPKSVVMVQCAGSRGDDLNYCSKVCCSHAVKNALKIKALDPASQVVVLYRDMRTYGFAEDAYREAREKGVIFIPYSLDNRPVIKQSGKKVTVSFFDPILRDEVSMTPDLLALSVGIVPEGTEELSKLLKIPVNEDKFYLEAHVKLRPVELPVSGVYVCGLAHSPKPVDEIIVQAQAAAAKAAIPLVQGHVSVEPTISCVDKDACIGCGLCESLCPYQSIRIIKDENGKRKAETITASCKGCGICASHCPVFAISMGGFTDDQINAQITAFGESREE